MSLVMRAVTTYHIAKLLGFEEKYLNQVIQRNYELFDESTFGCTMQPEGRSKRFTCLTKEGVVILTSVLDYKKYPEEKKKQIIAFKKWSARVIVDVLDGKISSDVMTWLVERKLSKLLYHAMTDAVKEKLIPTGASEKEQRMIYGREANLLNLVVFGKKANGVNQRETATADQLKCLNKCQSLAPGLLMDDIPFERRLKIMEEVIDQMMLDEKEHRERIGS